MINLIAYMSAFPESIVDGVPKDIVTKNNKIMRTVPAITDILTTGESTWLICPHFRRGYYKRLASDYFVNKKDQIIFVHETMVKGTAKTIIDV